MLFCACFVSRCGHHRYLHVLTHSFPTRRSSVLPGDGLDLHQVVGLQGRAGGDQVDDAPAQAQARRQLHGAVQLDALRLHAARGEEPTRSEEHTSELQSLMRISYAVFCLKKKKPKKSLHSRTTP